MRAATTGQLRRVIAGDGVRWVCGLVGSQHTPAHKTTKRGGVMVGGFQKAMYSPQGVSLDAAQGKSETRDKRHEKDTTRWVVKILP